MKKLLILLGLVLLLVIPFGGEATKVIFLGGGGGSGAPTDATYITQTADSTLSAEQAMGALGTGSVWSTTTTGVQSISDGLTSLGNLTETNGGIPYGTADDAYAWLAAGTANYLLQANGAAAPTWVNDLDTGTTIGTAYVYRVGGTDVADGDVADNITITNISQVADISATASEINTPLDGALVTLTEFQELETIGATTLAAEQWATLGGIAITLSAAELDILDGVTGLTAAELTYLNTVSSNVQDQLDAAGGGRSILASSVFN